MLLNGASGLQFYKTSLHDLKRLAQDADNIETNFWNYINGFSRNVREIIENFGLEKIIARLVKDNRLIKDRLSPVHLLAIRDADRL